MCQQNFLSKTVKIISIVSLSAIALGGVLNNTSWAMEIDSVPKEVLKSSIKQLTVKDLGHCSQVSHTWNWVSSRDQVWEEAAQKYALSGGRFHERFRFHGTSWKKI